MPNIYSKNDEDVVCSFCGKHLSEVDHLFAGPAVYICDRCIDKMSKTMEIDRKK